MDSLSLWSWFKSNQILLLRLQVWNRFMFFVGKCEVPHKIVLFDIVTECFPADHIDYQSINLVFSVLKGEVPLEKVFCSSLLHWATTSPTKSDFSPTITFLRRRPRSVKFSDDKRHLRKAWRCDHRRELQPKSFREL